MAKHKKETDWNKVPYDPSLPAVDKAKQFDEQYVQNHQYDSSTTPALDAHENDRREER